MQLVEDLDKLEQKEKLHKNSASVKKLKNKNQIKYKPILRKLKHKKNLKFRKNANVDYNFLEYKRKH